MFALTNVGCPVPGWSSIWPRRWPGGCEAARCVVEDGGVPRQEGDGGRQGEDPQAGGPGGRGQPPAADAEEHAG